jgi:hypothetical protein
MFYECLSVVSECLKTGKTAPEIKFNSTFFDFLGSKPEYLKDFTCGLASHSKWIFDELIPKIDLSNSRKVLSIGGHTGQCISMCA